MSMDIYYNNKQLLFSKTYPEFWNILTGSIALGGGPDTGPGTNYSAIFKINNINYITDTILNNTLYFNIGDILTIKYYLNDIYNTSKIRNNKIIQQEINKFFINIINKTNSINDEIIHLEKYLLLKISDEFKVSQKNKIWNPFMITYPSRDPITEINKLFTYNFDRTIHDVNMDMFKQIFIDLQRKVVCLHYYLMVYVYDLTLKMQKIKSELIKYELVRFKNKNYNLSVIDIVINECLLEYTKLNNEFAIYNPKLTKINYWGNHLMLWPNNINILHNYYNIHFDYQKNMFISVSKKS